MDDFTAPKLSLKEALQLYVFLAGSEDELEGGAYRLFSALREYLYARLSIEEMESPQTLLSKLDES